MLSYQHRQVRFCMYYFSVTNSWLLFCSDFFFPSSYVPHVAAKLIVLLKKLHSQLRTSHDCSVAFLGHLLGKMCITGHGGKMGLTDKYSTSVFPHFHCKCLRVSYIECTFLCIVPLGNKVQSHMLQSNCCTTSLNANRARVCMHVCVCVCACVVVYLTFL